MRVASRVYRLLATTAAVAAFAACNDENDATGPDRTLPEEGHKLAVLTSVTQDRTLYADTTYVLSGFVKVSNGATLTIQPGTKIVGDTLVPGSSLWILRGSKLIAEGTAENPIVFTSARAEGHRAPGDWGGIVIVGNAPINRTANPIFTEGPAGAAENYAGSNDIDDDSGSLRYVRIEFAGYDVSNGAGQELNGISLYAVGRGTTLEYIQTVQGLDDSFEWFGGAADARYLVSFESGDDHFDWTEGFQGRVQFALAVQTSVPTPRPGTGVVSGDPRGFEGDGCEVDKAGCTYANAPYSMPVFANFTLIGPGPDVYATNDGNGAVIRRGSGGTFVNGIVARWPGVGFSVRDEASGALMDVDSLLFRNIILAENGSNFEAPAPGRFGDRLRTNAAAWNISEARLADVFVGRLPTGSTEITDANLGVQPRPGSPAATGGLTSFAGTPIAARVENFFGGPMPATPYVGAVSPDGPPWYRGWTRWYRN